MDNQVTVIERNASMIEAMKTEQDEFSARDLHEFLQVETHFKDWIKRRIEKNVFRENIDYRLVAQKRATNNPKNPFTEINEYILTLDMAKHLALMEQNEQGQQFRNYFILAEKKAKQLEQVVNEQAEFIVSRRAYDFTAENMDRVTFNDTDITTVLHDGRTYYVLTEVSKAVGYSHPRGNVWRNIKTYLVLVPNHTPNKTVRVATLSGLLSKYRLHSKKTSMRTELGRFTRQEQERLKAITQNGVTAEQTTLPIDDDKTSPTNTTDTLLLLAGHAKRLGDDEIMNELINKAMETV